MNYKYYKFIPGWLSDNEAEELYKQSFNLNRNILEIGSMYGKSTSVICESIRDSEFKSIFDSYDINFKTRNQFLDFYTKVHGGATVPDLVEEYSFSKNKSIFDVTIEHLKKYNLLQYVNLHEGNFNVIDNKKYNFIFCDAMHDINEINLNLPHMKRLSENDCIWAIHDINLEILNEIKKHAKLLKTVDCIGVFVY
jgi:hypothetical protein